MAVFMINICKYNGCGITFPRLADLIEHIEDVHIDYDPAVVEQKEASQPSCIPLSYVLKFFTEASRREIQSMPPAAEVRRRLLSAPKTPSVRSSTPTGSDMDEDDMLSASEDSNDSWTTVEEYSSEYILRYGVNRLGANGGAAAGPAIQDKPFACPVPGCKKRYKNVNGIKYHSKNGHKKDGKVKKAYKCQCGKSYKTAQGLKSHSISQHIVGGLGAEARAAGAPGAAAGAPGVAAGLGAGALAAGASAAAGASPAPGPRVPGLVVTASPARPINAVDVDGTKLVRIYDSIKTKDLPTFTIPKHNLTGLSIVAGVRHGLVASADKRLERPRLTVQARPLTPHASHAPLAAHAHAHAPVAPLTFTNVGNVGEA